MTSVKSLKNSYFFSAFFWSTLSKVLNAILALSLYPCCWVFMEKLNMDCFQLPLHVMAICI